MSKEVPTPPSEESAFAAMSRANPNLQWLGEPVPTLLRTLCTIRMKIISVASTSTLWGCAPC